MANSGIGGLVSTPGTQGAPVLPGYQAPPSLGPVVSPPNVDYATIKSNMPEWQRIHQERIYNPEGGGQDIPPLPEPAPVALPPAQERWTREAKQKVDGRSTTRDGGLSPVEQGRADWEAKTLDPNNVFGKNRRDYWEMRKAQDAREGEDVPDFRKYGDRYAEGGPVMPARPEAHALAGAIDGMDSQNPGGFSDEDMNEIVISVQEAILNPGPDAEEVINNFISIFGEEEFERLKAMILFEQDEESDGVSDSIPAMVDGQQPAALSEGEYVVPADAVSGMGNGSTEAGARRLDDIVGQVRTQKTGSSVQPAAMSGIRGLM
jgi:hypothetical protein